MQSPKDSNVVVPADGKGDKCSNIGGNKLTDEDAKDNKNGGLEVESTNTGSPETVRDLEVKEAPDTMTEPHATLSPSEKKEILLDSDKLNFYVDNIRIINQISNLTATIIKLSYMPPKIKVKGRKEDVFLGYELLNKLISMTKNQSQVAELARPIFSPSSASGIGYLHSKELISDSSDGCLEVYVTDIENPNNFWVQIRSTRDQLNALKEEMTKYYNEEVQSPQNKESIQVNSISPGDIVAAFTYDVWYRAQVCDVLKENDQKKLFFFSLDVGFQFDLILSPDLVCILNPKFFALPFQAIECCLAGVKPIMNGEWSKEAIKAFEDITDANQMDLSRKKVIKAKPFRKLSVNGDNDLQKTVQLVQLFDLNKDVDDELIDMGYGKSVFEYSSV